MFTGIVEERGEVISVQKGLKSSVLAIRGKAVFDDLKLGDSVAVNGVCLTVTSLTANVFTADVMSETLNRSSLGNLKAGSPVNLERALPVDGRFGGHMVSGHIDGTGTVTAIARDGNAVWYTIQTTDKVMRYIVEKGSIAIDGISLTVASLALDSFRVSIIPHTAQATVLSEKAVGSRVNLENDILGKYVEKLLGLGQEKKPQSKLTKEFLAQAGYEGE